MGINTGGLQPDNTTIESDEQGQLSIKDGGVTAAKLNSGAATAGQVATADGSGGVAFQSHGGMTHNTTGGNQEGQSNTRYMPDATTKSVSILLPAASSVGDVIELNNAYASALEPADMTSNTAPSPYVASTTNGTTPNDAWKVFDRDDGTGIYLGSGTNPGGPYPYYLKLDCGAQKFVLAYELLDAGASVRATAWDIEGSNDDSAWTVIDTRSGQNVSTKQRYYLQTPGSYRYYRLKITAGNGLDVQIQTWQLYAVGLSVRQGAGQSITNGTNTTTTGTAGGIGLVGIGALRLVCVEANTKWLLTDSLGTPEWK